MKLEHEFTVPASVEETWTALNDLDRVVPCFPGASLTSVDGDDFVGACKVKLGPISLQYTGTGTFTERDEAAHRAVLEAKGKDKRGNGTASATVTATLAEVDEAHTSVRVVTDLVITGKPAQFGRGVMQDVSDKMLATFAECLQTELGEGAAPPEAGSATGPAAAVPTPEPTPAPSGAAAPPVHEASGDARSTNTDALDLGATVLPVL
ncbi:MAG: carbon monoxide dehydrogenase, partial [Propionibacteriales bacterium]|nr:carbon monoxide dehydrogenase [Propionibacteriales bacterium]